MNISWLVFSCSITCYKVYLSLKSNSWYSYTWNIFDVFVLFRNLVISLIGIVPNFIAAFFILGIIGLLGIPLDMMTITIAAITIGIAVDNSIHYIYRFREEFRKINDYNKTLDRCHTRLV